MAISALDMMEFGSWSRVIRMSHKVHLHPGQDLDEIPFFELFFF